MITLGKMIYFGNVPAIYALRVNFYTRDVNHKIASRVRTRGLDGQEAAIGRSVGSEP